MYVWICVCILYVHAKSQKFLWVFVLRRYPAFWPFFCTATQVHLLFSIKTSAVSNPLPPRLGLLRYTKDILEFNYLIIYAIVQGKEP